MYRATLITCEADEHGDAKTYKEGDEDEHKLPFVEGIQAHLHGPETRGVHTQMV